MAYDVTLFDGTTHTINGAGTSDDPWIIDCFEGLAQHSSYLNGRPYVSPGYYKFANTIIEKEREDISPTDTEEEIAKKMKTIDMNKVASGEARSVTDHPSVTNLFLLIGGNGSATIDGNGCTIKNLYTELNITGSDATEGTFLYIGSNGKVSNLNIENAYVNPLSITKGFALISVQSNTALLKNCKFSIMTNCKDRTSDIDIYGVVIGQATDSIACIQGCSFNIRNISGSLNLLGYGLQGASLIATVKNSVFRGYSPYLPSYVNSANRNYYCGIIKSVASSNGNSNTLNLINCKFIYETLNKNNDSYLTLALVNNGNNGFKMNIKNCVFDIINKKKSTYPINTIAFYTGTSSSFVNMGTNLYIYDEAGISNPSQNPNNMVAPITKAQSTNKDYLLNLLFPIMWEDED